MAYDGQGKGNWTNIASILPLIDKSEMFSVPEASLGGIGWQSLENHDSSSKLKTVI
jgi:hypothetical protein